MSGVFSLKEQMEKNPPWRDFDFYELGTLRVGRLSLNDKLRVHDIIQTIREESKGEDDEEEEVERVKTKANAEAFINIVALALRGPSGEPEFDCPEGRQWIETMEDLHFTRLCRIILWQCGIGELKQGDLGEDIDVDKVPDELEAAKND